MPRKTIEIGGVRHYIGPMDGLMLPLSASALAKQLSGCVIGNPDAVAENLAPLEKACGGSLCYFSDKKYAASLQKTKAAVVLTRTDLVVPSLPLTYVVVDSPQHAFGLVMKAVSERGRHLANAGSIYVDPTAKVDPTVCIGVSAYVGPGAIIAAGTRLFPFSYVGARVRIGIGCELHPHCVIWDGVRIGDRVTIGSHTVIGSDGFGLIHEGIGSLAGPLEEMPQIGTVVIEDDVRVGALCTIDRATLDTTRIGAGTKIDNQVHIGHNVRIGKNVVLCAQVGISGSAVLEDNVIFAGRAGVGPGVTAGVGSRLGAASVSTTNLDAGQTYYLHPAFPVRESLRMVRAMRRLPEILSRVRKLEAKRGEDGHEGA